METFFKKLDKLKKETAFDPARKRAIRSTIEYLIDSRVPVRVEDAIRQNMAKGSNIFTLFLKPMPVAGLLLVVAFLGGGTSLAAEGAVPGDFLYPVKVKFNEEVRAALAVSGEADASWEARRAERRLEEAVELSARGSIPAEAYARVEANFAASADRAQEKIEALDARGETRIAASIASRFEAALRAHEEILGRFEEGVRGDVAIAMEARASASAERKAAGKIRGELEETSRVRVSLDAKVASEDGRPGTKTAVEGKINAAQNVIASTQNYFRLHAESIGVRVAASADAKLKAAAEILKEAKAKLDVGAYGEAFVKAGEAERFAIEARSLLRAEFGFPGRPASLLVGPTPVSPSGNVPEDGAIVLEGEITCLPKFGPGPQTQECAIGLQANGLYYLLINLDQAFVLSGTGRYVKVSGTFTVGRDAIYDVVGTIDVEKVEPIGERYYEEPFRSSNVFGEESGSSPSDGVNADAEAEVESGEGGAIRGEAGGSVRIGL